MPIAGKCLGIVGGQIAIALSCLTLGFMNVFGIVGVIGGILAVIGGFNVEKRSMLAVWFMGIGSVTSMLSLAIYASIPLTVGAILTYHSIPYDDGESE